MAQTAEDPPRVADTSGGDIADTLRRAASALQRADVPFMLGGSLACWARGAPETRNDVDLLVTAAGAEAATAALAAEGMRVEPVPEDWLHKVWDGEVMVDLITSTLGNGPVTDDAIASAERMSVLALSMAVARLEDVLVAKLLSIDEHRLDYASPLAVARAVREQVDWREVHRRVAASPYARTFFALLQELDIVTPEEIRGS